MCRNNAIRIVERHFQGKTEWGLPILCFSDSQMRSTHGYARYHDHCNTYGSYRFDGIVDNSYPLQHIPKTGRTQVNSYRRKLASKIYIYIYMYISCPSYHTKTPSKTPRTQDISYPGQVVSKTTRTLLVDQIESKEMVPMCFLNHLIKCSCTYFSHHMTLYIYTRCYNRISLVTIAFECHTEFYSISKIHEHHWRVVDFIVYDNSCEYIFDKTIW